MAVPAWRPMPKTEEDESLPEYREGARIRAKHRTLMALRWRNKEARSEDKKLKRLPEDWHEWMNCPGVDQGYGTQLCTCDQPLNQHPRELVIKERCLRKVLAGELKFTFKERKTAIAEGRNIVVNDADPLVKVQWVKTIDTAGCAPNIQHRRRLSYGLVKGGTNFREEAPKPIALYNTNGSASHSAIPAVSTRCRDSAVLRAGIRLRLPPWITAGGRALYYMLRGCSPAR